MKSCIKKSRALALAQRSREKIHPHISVEVTPTSELENQRIPTFVVILLFLSKSSLGQHKIDPLHPYMSSVLPAKVYVSKRSPKGSTKVEDRKTISTHPHLDVEDMIAMALSNRALEDDV